MVVKVGSGIREDKGGKRENYEKILIIN